MLDAILTAPLVAVAVGVAAMSWAPGTAIAAFGRDAGEVEETTMGAHEVRVLTVARGRALEVRASAEIDASRELIWATITDYEALGGFLPGLATSRVIERSGSIVRVRQTGRAHLLMFGFPIDVVIDATERPPDTLEARLVSGTLHQLDGRYLIEPTEAPARWRLRWDGVIEPRDDGPAFLARMVARATMQQQFEAMVGEIRRRARKAPRRRRARKAG